MPREIVPQDAFRVEAPVPYFRIHGVEYRGRQYVDDICTTLLAAKTHKEHVRHAAKARPDRFRAYSLPRLYAQITALHSHRAGEYASQVEDVRAFLAGFFGWTCLNTLSLVRWRPRGLDEVVHYGLPKKRVEKAEMIGPDGRITDRAVDAECYAQKLCGTTDGVGVINSRFKWLTGKDACACRFNEPPSIRQDVVVSLGVCNYDRFDLGAIESIDYIKPALGVRVVEQKLLQSK